MNIRRYWFRLVKALALLAVLGGPGSEAGAATQAQIDAAIQSALAWQATQQDPVSGGYFYSYPLAETAMAVLAFENEGNFPGGGSPYSVNVEKGLDYIFYFANKIPIGHQTYGDPGRNDDPDTNGNGLGVFFSQYTLMYETGLVMQAIAASNTPDRVVATGPCSGMTYRQVMEDLVDFLAWAQIDAGPGRGGWRYWYYDNGWDYGDNSVAQWPVLGLIAASQWGISAPAFVKSEMEYWVGYIQNPNDGGSGYDTPFTMVNIAKTGGLLVEFYFLGDTRESPRVKAALNYINAHWNDPLNFWDGNRGHPYAMFSVFKGLELLQVPTVANAAATPDTPAGDWWGDYAEFLVLTQSHPTPGLGYWSGYFNWGPYLATPWDIVILQASVFPVSVDITVPGYACDLTGYEVDIDYSVERFTASGTLNVYRDGVLFDTVTLTDFKGTASRTYTIAPETLGDHTWKAVLAVSGSGISTQAEDSAGGTVYSLPRVAGIPDQVTPFSSFDLDDFQSCDCEDLEWNVSAVPPGWSATIDVNHVVTVTAPPGATDAVAITFTAIFHWPGIDCIASDTAVFSPNRPPFAHPGKLYPNEKYAVAEGGAITLDGTLSSDPDGDALASFAWDFDGDGIFEVPGATPVFSAAGMDGPDELYVHLQVCDEHGACGVGTAEIEIENVAPVVSTPTVSQYVVPVNTTFSVSATFTDAGTPDTHLVSKCNFGDGGDPHPSAVSETGGSGTANTSSSDSAHTDYALPGIYTVTVTVTDDDGATGSATTTVVAYDPSAGFVTGGGWIDSPAGAYRADPSLTGKANFGFVSKYQKGATKPTGQTEFNFQTAGLNFHSASYDWMVVTGGGTGVQYKGVGTINGTGSYRFMLWARDGVPDKFRIRIWQEIDGVETDIYDNGFDQPIGGGSIVIKTK
ncbi:MAG: hypothetical protein FDZ69_09470 [Deltaproteobacteria bacterium]|nr:MAG: hypothetical protein FDZ69_09470 [Deltaproteobacteria bacterium]